jgi:hypothetical protein
MNAADHILQLAVRQTDSSQSDAISAPRLIISEGGLSSILSNVRVKRVSCLKRSCLLAISPLRPSSLQKELKKTGALDDALTGRSTRRRRRG